MSELWAITSRFDLSGEVMAQVFVCDKCGESPDGDPSAVVSFRGKDGTEQNFESGTSQPTLCESCAPKLYRLINGFLKK